jgi:hypothetical protein
MKGIDNVFNDEPVAEGTSYEKSTSSAGTETKHKKKKMTYKESKAKQTADDEGESSLKIDEDYTDSGKKVKKPTVEKVTSTSSSKKSADDDEEESTTSTKQTADEAEPESFGEIKAQKMRNYFKKSKVYKNYQRE